MKGQHTCSEWLFGDLRKAGTLPASRRELMKVGFGQARLGQSGYQRPSLYFWDFCLGM